jgi:predicted Zn-dependent protease
MRRVFLRPFAIAALAAIGLGFACSTVPYTERTRVILISEEEELQLGLQAYEEALSKAKLCQDEKKVALVRKVGQRIAAVADRPDYQWEFHVIEDDKTVNAFCLPGGKVAFYTGILPICKDEAGIAVVMGHEVSHAIARHGAERISQSLVLNLGASALGAVLGGKDPKNQQLVAGLFGAGFAVAFALPFSRSHESEADHIGVILMAKAGYDPREAPKFWRRMIDQTEGEEPPEFLSTHPSHETRVDDLEMTFVPEAMEYYEKATGKKTDYHKRAIKVE